MTPEQIKIAVSKAETSLDLLELLNKVKKEVYGDRCHPFSLKLLNYYCSPTRASKAYAHFKIPKKSGGFREISAPTKSLKSILTCLNVVFQSLYEPSTVAKGFLPRMSVVDNAAPHIGMLYVFNTDLKDFFPSIELGRVWTVLQLPQYGFKKDIARIVAGLCCMRVLDQELSTKEKTHYKYVLPQGAPTSPILTNMVCQKLDRRLQGIAKRFNLHCTRYADDISFSGMHNVFQPGGEFIEELKHVILDQGFTINESKTRLQKKGERQEVTGLTVCEKVNVCRKYVRDLQSILYIWERYGYSAASARFSVHDNTNRPKSKKSACAKLERVVMGKLMYLKMVKGETDKTYIRLYYKFVALCPSSAKETSAYMYELVYKLSEFEKEYETEIQFKFKKEDPQSSTAKFPYAITRINESNVYVRISKSCSNTISLAMSSDDTKAVEEFKDKFYIVLCSKTGKKPFWIIMKSNPQNLMIPQQTKEVEVALSRDGQAMDIHYPVAAGQNCEHIDNIDNILTEFIESNFDLSILDKWDRTSNS